MYDGMDVVVGGGVESISLVQNDKMNIHKLVDEELVAMHNNIYMPMLQTAEVVAQRYNVNRDVMDEYGLQSQLRVAAAYEAGSLTTKSFLSQLTVLCGIKRRVSNLKLKSRSLEMKVYDPPLSRAFRALKLSLKVELLLRVTRHSYRMALPRK